MAAESQVQSIQARIAALNLGHVGRAPITAKSPNGAIPERPQLEERAQTTTLILPTHAPGSGIGNEPNGPRREGVLPPPTNITRTGQTARQQSKPAAAPPPTLPQRRQSTQPSPALPPRRPSEHLSRKASNESVSSTMSTISSISALSNGTARTPASRASSVDMGRVKAPTFDPSTHPPLPPKRTKADIEKRYEDIEKSKAFPGYKEVKKSRMLSKTTPSVATVELVPPPSLPPRRPSRLEKPARTPNLPEEQPPPKPARSALSYGMNKTEHQARIIGESGREPSPAPSENGAPPPIPISSRPDLSKLQSSKPKSQLQHNPVSGCLLCRNFSAPDTHATKFGRQSVPSLDWLATQLVAPFTSLTDQARAIFTWLHHNIDYDTVAFFGNNVQPSTPASTLSTGLAVCEGYAALFTALATKAGLESVVISGHGKGFGFSDLAPGSSIPPESHNHAWNAVKIDNGEWKLLDSCWGAGNIRGAGEPYNKDFSPQFFTMSNEKFGLRHYPTNKSHFFRADGRRIGWEEYILGDTGGQTLNVFSGVMREEGMSETSFLPKYLKVPVAPSAHPGPTIRFQFSRICEHWDPQRDGPGKPYVFTLAVHGVDGREDDYVPFETNGMFWWVDVEPRKLGARGQTVTAFAVTTVGGADARGLSVEEWRIAKRSKGMGFGGLAAWELV